MSILIKGMNMPKNDSWFNVRIKEKDGKPIIAFITGEDLEGKYFEIEEIPTQHGRLIDADALMECRLEPNHYEELKDGYIPDYDLDSAPTIIEAEVSKNA